MSDAPIDNNGSKLRFRKISAPEELSSAVQAVLDGSIQAIQCHGAFCREFAKTYQSVLKVEKPSWTNFIFDMTVNAASLVTSDPVDTLDAAGEVIKHSWNFGHLANDFKNGLKNPSPLAICFFAVRSAISVGGFVQKRYSAKQKSRDILRCLPYGEICIYLSGKDFKLANFVDYVIIWKHGVKIPELVNQE